MVGQQLVERKSAPGPLATQLERVCAATSQLLRVLVDDFAKAADVRSAITAASALGDEDLREVEHAAEPATAAEHKTFLRMLVSAWPNAGQNDLAGYGAQLADDVREQRPSRYALAAAAKKLRRSSRFLPSICEVLETIGEAETQMSSKISTVARLPDYLARAAERLVRAERDEERSRAWEAAHRRRYPEDFVS